MHIGTKILWFKWEPVWTLASDDMVSGYLNQKNESINTVCYAWGQWAWRRAAFLLSKVQPSVATLSEPVFFPFHTANACHRVSRALEFDF